MKFRKKPVVIDAYQTDKEMDIETLEGTMHANVGDWIITGVKGEKYPCAPDVFEQTYTPVNYSECDLCLHRDTKDGKCDLCGEAGVDNFEPCRED